MRRVTNEDFSVISSWYEARSLKVPKFSEYPNLGFIVEKTAAGFMYLVDGKLALLEGYITNPKASATERNEALDKITTTLLAEAKELGIHRVFTISSIGDIHRRAFKHGFRYKPTALMIYEGKNE